MTQKAEHLLNNCRNERIKNIFGETKVTLALKQPPNILRLLTSASFTSKNEKNVLPNGLYKCNDVRCLLCKFYIQECNFFRTSNNVEWEIREHITCNSKCTLYFLKCRICNLATTYTGKTNTFRLRMNNHISDSRTGNSTDRFDIHVYNCRQKYNYPKEPFFQIYAFMTVPNERMLIPYEKYLHSKGFDTMN